MKIKHLLTIIILLVAAQKTLASTYQDSVIYGNNNKDGKYISTLQEHKDDFNRTVNNFFVSEYK